MIESNNHKKTNVVKIFSLTPLEKRRILKSLYLKLPFKPIIIFLYLYVIKFSFMDGKEGLYFCALRASHELNISAKIFEAKKTFIKNKSSKT